MPSPAAVPAADSGLNNPVWQFYSVYYAGTRGPCEELHAALDNDASVAALNGSLALCALESAVSEGMMSLGLLMGTDAGTYASDVQGAANGSGSIAAAEDDGTQALSFLYEDGTALTGTLNEYQMEYVFTGEPAYTLRLCKAAQGWAARLTYAEGGGYALRTSAQGIIEFCMLNIPPESLPEEDAAPPQADAPEDLVPAVIPLPTPAAPLAQQSEEAWEAALQGAQTTYRMGQDGVLVIKYN
ncbi:MAG: hypothetical protein LBN26_02670 [Christensenellaceae bacterium]|nr:hypothetical protein [Christensenellaceae bacterium]